jgi:hypothetical protein
MRMTMPTRTVIVMSLAMLVPVPVLMPMLVVPVVVLMGGGIVMRFARPVLVLVLVRVLNVPMAMHVRMPDGSRHRAQSTSVSKAFLLGTQGRDQRARPESSPRRSMWMIRTATRALRMRAI